VPDGLVQGRKSRMMIVVDGQEQIAPGLDRSADQDASVVVGVNLALS
jgi:hypothetical protein